MGPGARCPQPHGGSSRWPMQPRLQRAEGTRESCDLQAQLISLRGRAVTRLLKETAAVRADSGWSEHSIRKFGEFLIPSRAGQPQADTLPVPATRRVPLNTDPRVGTRLGSGPRRDPNTVTLVGKAPKGICRNSVGGTAHPSRSFLSIISIY